MPGCESVSLSTDPYSQNPPTRTHFLRRRQKIACDAPQSIDIAGTQRNQKMKTKQNEIEKKNKSILFLSFSGRVFVFPIICLRRGPHSSDHLQRNNLLVTSYVCDSFREVNQESWLFGVRGCLCLYIKKRPCML